MFVSIHYIFDFNKKNGSIILHGASTLFGFFRLPYLFMKLLARVYLRNSEISNLKLKRLYIASGLCLKHC